MRDSLGKSRNLEATETITFKFECLNRESGCLRASYSERNDAN
jgi:hypothetical protein